jgi:hypothetical protein
VIGAWGASHYPSRAQAFVEPQRAVAKCSGRRCHFVRHYCQTLSKSGSASMTMTAAQAKAVKRNADGSLPPMK